MNLKFKFRTGQSSCDNALCAVVKPNDGQVHETGTLLHLKRLTHWNTIYLNQWYEEDDKFRHVILASHIPLPDKLL